MSKILVIDDEESIRLLLTYSHPPVSEFVSQKWD